MIEYEYDCLSSAVVTYPHKISSGIAGIISGPMK